MLEQIREIIKLDANADADIEQIIHALNMIAEVRKQHGNLPDDIAEWEELMQYEYYNI